MKDFTNWRTDTVEMFVDALEKFDIDDEQRAIFADHFVGFLLNLDRTE